MDNHKMVCPKHQEPLYRTQTKYGGRWACSVQGCTVVAWEGRTSTPADKETRDARQAAHAAFDPLWKSGRMRRTEAYTRLSEFMGIRKPQCHIGMFGLRQCQEVLKFVEHQNGS